MRTKSHNSDAAGSQKKKGKGTKIIVTILAIILGLAIGAVGFIIYYKNWLLNKVTYVTTPPAEATMVDESGNTVRVDDVRPTTYYQPYLYRNRTKSTLFIIFASD